MKVINVAMQHGIVVQVGSSICIDAYSVLLDRKILIFNHSIKAINLSKKEFEQVDKTWGQTQFFKQIMDSKKSINIVFNDNERVKCKLTGYLQDKIFTDDPQLSLIQKGSISIIEIV